MDFSHILCPSNPLIVLLLVITLFYPAVRRGDDKSTKCTGEKGETVCRSEERTWNNKVVSVTRRNWNADWLYTKQ
jgi:hypothetical protein